MRVKTERLIGQPNYRALDAAVDAMIQEADEAKDVLYLSDLLVDMDTAGMAEPLLVVLRDDPTKKYTLHFMRDEWGNQMRPGDVVRRKFKRPLTRKVNGQHITIPSTELNQWKRSGIYDQKRFYHEEYTLDERGCVKVSAADLEYFLTQWGVHSFSGSPISYHAMEHSEDDAPAPNGDRLHVWYWRCKEVTKDQYKNLPKLSPRGDGELRRGIDPKPEPVQENAPPAQ
jgi:hypothetical protein